MRARFSAKPGEALRRRGHLGRYWLMGGGVAAVLAGVVLAGASAAPEPKPAGSRLPVAQIVAISRRMLAGLSAPGVKTAQVIRTTLNAAENVTYPGSEPPDPGNPRAYLIMLRGRFICTSCSTPPGAKAPRGTFAYSIWIPGRGSPTGGLQPRTPRKLKTLGPIINLPLVPPHASPAELVLHPGSGLGPVRLGVPVPTIDQAAGPAIAPGQWVVGPIEVDTQTNRHGRVDRLVVLSRQATIDGHPLSDGYATLRSELAGWHAVDCRVPRTTLHVRLLVHADRDGVSTRLEFIGTRFTGAFIEVLPAGTCMPAFPAG
jgi:hypothetical protein